MLGVTVQVIPLQPCSFFIFHPRGWKMKHQEDKLVAVVPSYYAETGFSSVGGL